MATAASGGGFAPKSPAYACSQISCSDCCRTLMAKFLAADASMSELTARRFSRVFTAFSIGGASAGRSDRAGACGASGDAIAACVASRCY